MGSCMWKVQKGHSQTTLKKTGHESNNQGTKLKKNWDGWASTVAVYEGKRSNSHMCVSVLVFFFRSGLCFWGDPCAHPCSLYFGNLMKNETNLRDVLWEWTYWTSATNGHSVGRTRPETVSSIKLHNIHGGNMICSAPAVFPCWSAYIVQWTCCKVP